MALSNTLAWRPCPGTRPSPLPTSSSLQVSPRACGTLALQGPQDPLWLGLMAQRRHRDQIKGTFLPRAL